MKKESIKINQQYYTPVYIDGAEKDIIQICQAEDLIQLERENIQKLIDILTAEL